MAIARARTLAVAEVSHSGYGPMAMRVRLWAVLSSLGAVSCGDSVIIARELAVQALSADGRDAGADAGDHVLGVPHGSSEGHSPVNTHLPPPSPPKPSVHPVEVPHRSSSTSISPSESTDGGSHTDPTAASTAAHH